MNTRFFLYTYSLHANFIISKRTGVFGTWKDETGLDTKVKQLRRGDLIIIRNGEEKLLHFLGQCRVVGDVFNQYEYSPYRDLLWQDEIDQGQIFYPMRVPVDFYNVPELTLDRITWEDLDALKFDNKKGFPLQGSQMWAKKLAGNFLEAGNETESFARLVNLRAG